ncbi:MAG: DUF4884 domain-containing protein [Dysgonamonadaceae bacterium]|jgi:hypothetical protein|nr:DUF4884 domain-containing protein [Dysgonamonadaceae bacterium]
MTKKLIKIFPILVLSIIFFSCGSIYKPIESVSPQNNKSFKVEYLFEYDGCKVYRFQDHGRYVYFTNCKGNTISIENDSIQITNQINQLH